MIRPLKFIVHGPVLLMCMLAWVVQAHPLQNDEFPVINLTISQSQYSQLKKSKGKKLELKDIRMTVNSDTAKVKDVHARGNNSLLFSRKSLSVDLGKPITIRSGGKKISIKNFYLLNLVMDKKSFAQPLGIFNHE